MCQSTKPMFFKHLHNKLRLVSLFCIYLVCSITATNAKTVTELGKVPILDLSAYQQAELIASGKLSSERLVQLYLKRIEKYDKGENGIQAILSINPNALEEAKEKDIQARQAIKQDQTLGKLHGVPVIVKDNVETSELPTTAGSLALQNNFTLRDAPIIAKLKLQGAIILAKSNLSQWANFRDNDSISGWSALGGQTRNPHSLDRTPCGSSSGSGAAVAAQFAPLAIGTETNGSIICPSTMNGIVGFKPTVGLLSRRHIIPISAIQDTAGPMTRSVKDAALMMNVMAGTDTQDSSTELADEKKEDYIERLDNSLEGVKIGVLRKVQSNHKAIIDNFNEAISTLEAQGAKIVEIDQDIDMPDEFWQKSLELLLIEFKEELNKYLASTPDTVEVRNLQELIAFNQDNPRELVLFGQSLFTQAQEKTGYDKNYDTIAKYLKQATQKDGIDKLLKEHEVDVLMTPSQTPAFLIDAIYGDSFPGGFAGIGYMAAIAGYPHITVPMGNMKGLPVGVSFIAGQYEDGLVLNVAHQYEKASNKIIKPEFAQSAINHSSTKEAMRPIAH